MADIFSDCMSCSCRRRRSVWSSNTSTAAPGSAMGIAVKDNDRSPWRISIRVAVGSASARATGSDHAGGSNPIQGRPGIAVTGTWMSSAKTRLARRTMPCASTMQMAWVIASTVFSHSRFAEERSSTSRAFSSAMAAWASTAVTRVSSASPSTPWRSLASDTAPTARPAATSGAPIQDPGGGSVRVAPRRRASSCTLRGKARGPRRRASCSSGSSVRAGTGLVSWVTASRFVSASSRMTLRRSGWRISPRVRATSSTTVAGRKAPASSWESVVSRASNSTAARGVAALEGGLGMILANVRGRLRAQDFRLIALALARGDAVRRARYERLLLERGPDPLLDEPGLLEALLLLRSLVIPSAALFAYVAVRHTLLASGVTDRELADYLAALVLEFGDHDRHARLRRADDQTYRYLVDMVGELTGMDDTGERGFLLRVHLGNYSLWLAGLFPDYVEARHSRQGGPDLPYYDELGRQGYRLAAEHRLAARFGVAEIYRTAAQRFPTLRVAFNRLSDRVFFPHVSTPEKILRNL